MARHWLALVAALLVATSASAEQPKRLVGHGGPIRAVTVSPDARHALTASFDYSAILWNLATGTIVHRLDDHDAAVNDAVFAKDRIVTVADDGILRVFDARTGKRIGVVASPPVKVLDVAVSAEGRLTATARWDRTVRLYDLEALREVATLEGHRGNVNAVVFAGDTLHSASEDGTIRSWPLERTDDAVTAKASPPILDHGWGINVLAALPDGRLAWGALDGTAGVVDPRTGEAVRLIEGRVPIQSVDVRETKAGARLGFGDAGGTAHVFDVATLAPLDKGRVAHGPVFGLAFLPDESAALHVGLDDFASIWRFEPSRPVALQSQYPRRFQERANVDADPGEIEFRRKCSVCHTLVPDGANRAGPTLHGVFGRRAGAVGGYIYSDALANSPIVWTRETIGRLFGDGPDVVVPGTKMPIQRLKNVERREALLNYLEEATKP